jgi:non-specific serine/threonine protein kinase
VPSLAIPDLASAPHLDELARFPAVRLFVERARAVQHRFALTDENAPTVARICVQVDGLPLALELGAARVRSLTVGQIADRMDSSFRLLIGGSRNAPTRQQTLKATLDWSHDLLSASERTVFRRLAPFAGGWELEAAEAVCAGDGIKRADVLDLLTCLVDKSLVQAEEHAGKACYRLLEPIRQYAQEHLTALGECEAVRDRHSAHYLVLAEHSAAALWGSRVTGPFGSAAQLAWHARMEQDHDNLRAGLTWAKDQGQPETLGRWCTALWGFWFLHGHFDECRRWVEAALAPGTTLPPGLRARLLGPWGMMAKLRGDYEAAVGPFEESLTLFRSIGDEWHVAAQLSMVGLVLGCSGDFLKARRRLEESVAAFRALGDAWGLGFGLLNFGQVLRYQGDLPAARALLEEGLPLFRSYGDVFKELVTQIELGGLALEQNDIERAANLAREGLLLLRDSRMRWYLPEALELAAGLSAAQGRPAQAALLFGAAETAREVTGAALQAQGENAYARDVRATLAALGDDAFRTAWTAGRTLSPGQAIDEALAVAMHQATPASATNGPLTHREREVAGLIAHGLTNRQIAEQLVISPRTAERHVSNILDKLGLATRTAVAAWAVEPAGAPAGG